MRWYLSLQICAVPFSMIILLMQCLGKGVKERKDKRKLLTVGLCFDVASVEFVARLLTSVL